MLLDLACGPGRVALRLSSYFREVWAVDLEPEMIDVGRNEAKKNGIENVRWMVGRAEDVEAPECILWLNVSVETALKRIQKRGRLESVDLEYLSQLAESYDRTLEDLEGRGVRVIRADWNKDLSDTEYSYHADSLLTRLLQAHVDA